MKCRENGILDKSVVNTQITKRQQAVTPDKMTFSYMMKRVYGARLSDVSQLVVCWRHSRAAANELLQLREKDLHCTLCNYR
jgi:hypothetical protein